MPYVTWGLIVINVVTFLAMAGSSQAQQSWIVFAYAVTPAAITGALAAHKIGWADLGLLTGMFLHAGWGHLLGNMIYLWVFGDDIEDALGPVRFLLFYLLAGIAAALVFVAVNPYSPTPLVGASGAISGVLAAYLMLRPCAKVSVFVLRVVVRVRCLLGDRRLGVVATIERRREGERWGRLFGACRRAGRRRAAVPGAPPGRR